MMITDKLGRKWRLQRAASHDEQLREPGFATPFAPSDDTVRELARTWCRQHYGENYCDCADPLQRASDCETIAAEPARALLKAIS